MLASFSQRLAGAAQQGEHLRHSARTRLGSVTSAMIRPISDSINESTSVAQPSLESGFCSDCPLGVTNIRTFVDQENPKRVAVLMDVADMDALMAAMQTPEMAGAMDYDGVLPETLVILTEA